MIISGATSALILVIVNFFFYKLFPAFLEKAKKKNGWQVALAIMCIIIAFSLYFTINSVISQNDSPNPDISQNDSPERIILLLPVGKEAQQNVRQDAEMQFLGLFDYMSQINHTEAQEVKVIPRGNDFNSIETKNIVIEEMKRGSRFFVVTMSLISRELAKKWASICREHSNNEDCYLITTVASAPDIANAKDNVFRFYIRSEEEGARLAGIGQENGRKSAASICVDDTYGDEASKAFIKSWGNSPEKIQKLLIESKSDEDQYYERISEIVKEKPDCIFIANYGDGLASTIKALHKHQFHPFLLLTSTFSIKAWRGPVESILDNFDWKTLQPVYRNSGTQYNNVVRNFTFFTLLRVHKAIIKSKKESRAFSDIWESQEELPSFGLDLEFSSDGDCSISLKEYENEFNSEDRNNY